MVYHRLRMRQPTGTTFSRRTLFLKKWLDNRVGIGSVTPSSGWMCQELVRYVDPARPQRILELGPGTGVVTRAILCRMHPKSTLMAVEQDPDFATLVGSEYPQVDVIEGGFEEIDGRLPEDITFDVVISGMPTAIFPPRLIASLRRMLLRRAPDAPFSQLTEIPMVFHGLYRRMFRIVRFRFVPLNIPPGGVYHCFGVRAVQSRVGRFRGAGTLGLFAVTKKKVSIGGRLRRGVRAGIRRKK